MDKRTLFFLVFIITLISTLVVAVTCLLTGQSVFHTILYTVAAMWIMGVVSQLLLQSLYQSIVKPLEDQKAEENKSLQQQIHDIDDIEEIDQALNRMSEENNRLSLSPLKTEEEPSVGVHVEQKG